jgi:hypothetical protein
MIPPPNQEYPSTGRKKARRERMLARAAQVKSIPTGSWAGPGKHSGIGQAAKALQAAQASGAKHTGAGIALKKKLRGLHPDAKSVNYY